MRSQLLNRVSVLAIFVALGLGAVGCGKKTPSPATAATSPLSSGVVESSRTPLERDVDGTIEAVNQATVSAQTSGRVVEILYDVNDVVPAGAVIVRLKGTEQRAGLQGAQAALTEARARNEEAPTSYQRIARHDDVQVMYDKQAVLQSDYVAILLRANLAACGLSDRCRVIVGDYRKLKLPSIAGRTLFIGTPPYVRHHELSSQWKQWYSAGLKKLGCIRKPARGTTPAFLPKDLPARASRGPRMHDHGG